VNLKFNQRFVKFLQNESIPIIDVCNTTMKTATSTLLRLNGSAISKLCLEDICLIPRVPCVLSDCSNSWKASHSWTPDALLSKYANSEFECGRISATEPNLLTLKHYLAYCESVAHALTCTSDNPMYLFDAEFAEGWNTSADLAHDYTVPEQFTDDLFCTLRADLRPDYRWLIIGPKGSGTYLHVDPLCTSAWNTLISGYKKWVILEPLENESVSVSNVDCYDEKGGGDRPSIAEWFERTLHGDPFENTGDNVVKIETLYGKGFVFTQQPGETVFVPWGWQHAVLNLPGNPAAAKAEHGSPAIAVTHNFIPKRSIAQVDGFLNAARQENKRWTPGDLSAIEAAVRRSVLGYADRTCATCAL